MLNLINENIQAGSETRYLGKTGFPAAAVFAGVILMPTAFYESQFIQPLKVEYATVSGSIPSYETVPNDCLPEINPLKALVEYFLESDDVIPSEFASIPRERFFQIYERF